MKYNVAARGKKAKIIYGLLMIIGVPGLLYAEKGSFWKSLFTAYILGMGANLIFEAIHEYRSESTSVRRNNVETGSKVD